MLIIEGPDGSGKSHLVDVFERLFNVRSLKFGGPPVDDADGRNRLDYLRGLDPDDFVMMDRCPITSEFVYGQVLRGSTRPPINEILDALGQLRERTNPVIVMCQNPAGSTETIDTTTEKSWKPPALHAAVAAKFPEILERYEILRENLSSLDFDVIDWNFRTKSPGRLISAVVHRVYRRFPEVWFFDSRNAT